MKKRAFNLSPRFVLYLFIPLVLLISCEKNNPDPDEDLPGGSNMQFVAAYNPTNGEVIGADKATAILSIKNGELQYSTLSAYYAESNNPWTNGDVSTGGVAIGLHNDFDGLNNTFKYTSHGLYLDFATASEYLLPMLSPGQDDDYPFIVTNSVKKSNNGYVFYLSASNDKYYGDQYRASLVRYNSATQAYDVAESPVGFALSQPEVGSDTETAQFKRNFYVSNDGRYVYGVLEAFGVSGGALHWDYEILFQYDFETAAYKRLGAPGDDNPTLLGITSDGEYLAYWNAVYKIQNLGSEAVQELSVGSTTFHPPLQWNGNGYCEGSTTGIYYTDILNNTSQKVVEQYGTHCAQFDAAGSHIIFYLEGTDVNYLCKTIDLNEATTWDTIAGFPVSFDYIMLIK